MNVCLGFNIELRFTCSVPFSGFKSKRCPEKLESMKQSATKPGGFITCILVTGMMFLDLYLGGGKEKQKPSVFLATFV